MQNIDQLLLEIQNLKQENLSLKKELNSKSFLIDHLPCMVSWVNRDLKYISVNKNLEEFLGMSTSDIHDKKVGELFDQKDEFSNFIKEFFSTDISDSQREINSFVNNQERCFYIRAQKYNDNQEAILIGFDITDKKQLENQLQHNDKIRAIAQLATSIVHEIKNPLMIIKGNCELLEHSFEELEEDKKIAMVQKVHHTSDRIFNIIEGLKNLARDDFNDLLVPTKLMKIIDETSSILKPKMTQENINFKITNNLQDQNLSITCIEGQIIQILANLITNSMDEMPKYKDKWIELKLEETNKNIKVIVSDSGAPIEPKAIGKIFAPYYTTKPKGIGTGLGLSICLSLAKKNNANLEYLQDSKNPTFVLTISK